jgi:isoleucyl-tRNA synthetase
VGNVVPPQKVMNELGADVLRLWVAATDFSGDMSVSDEILKRTADSYRRMRNTARFMLSNLAGFEPEQHALAFDDMLALDRWAVERSGALQQELLEAYETYQFHHIYQKLHNFCVVDMGGFYLDIIKDRQYTTQANSLPRRSAQTALYHIVEAFTRWIAPILSFTADELWEAIPGEHSGFVFASEWYELPRLPAGTELDNDYWQFVMEVKTAVNKALEARRNAGEVGKSLAAEVTLYCDDAVAHQLQRLGDELRFVLITSSATIKPTDESGVSDPGTVATDVEGLWVKVEASPHQKCARCWHHLQDVGQHREHPELCGRCVDNVDGAGEERLYA